MVRRDGFLPTTARWWQLTTLVFLLVCLVAGCGGSMTPEQKQTFAKYQAMGGRVNFKRGGYELDLTNTQVADADLVHLKKIGNLKTLDLRDTPITDAGLEHLRSIDTLVFVALPRATVTAEAAESLRKSLPETDVQR
jgi:hypothetical protein